MTDRIFLAVLGASSLAIGLGAVVLARRLWGLVVEHEWRLDEIERWS